MIWFSFWATRAIKSIGSLSKGFWGRTNDPSAAQHTPQRLKPTLESQKGLEFIGSIQMFFQHSWQTVLIRTTQIPVWLKQRWSSILKWNVPRRLIQTNANYTCRAAVALERSFKHLQARDRPACMCMQNTAMARRWHDLTGHLVNPSRRTVKEDAQRKESAAQAYVTLYKRGPTRGSTLLKRHYGQQTGRCNPPALGVANTSTRERMSPDFFMRPRHMYCAKLPLPFV